VLLASAWFSHFAVLINDVFLLRWQAEHLSISAPESFYNGFFPIGYPLILRAALFTGNPIFTLMFFQILLASFYAMLVYRLFVWIFPSITDEAGIAHDAGVGWQSAVIALPLVLFAPPVIHAILSATPDFFSALATLIGFLFIIRESKWNFVLAGACIGFGCLFRSHLLVLFIALALSLLLFQNGRRWNTFLGFCAGALPFVIAQGLVQIWSGHGFFENAQAFNIWKTMHGMDWSNPPALGHAKALGIIMEDPMLFVSSACNWLLFYSFYLVPLIGVVILALVRSRSNSPTIPRSLVSLAVAALLYLGVSAAGGSISAFTPVIPIVAACAIPLIGFALSRCSPKFQDRTLSSIAAIIWIGGLTGFIIYTMREAGRVNDYAKIEKILNIQSRSDALGIYTDDYDFYFPGSNYQAPRTTGGWGEVGLPNYLREFPHIHNASAKAEYRDLIANGIQWAIYRIPPYDPLGYEGVKNDTAHFRLVYRTPFHEIYHIQ
jgi:hypothetical protein